MQCNLYYSHVVIYDCSMIDLFAGQSVVYAV